MKGLDLFNLKQRRVKGYLNAIYKYLIGRYRQDGSRPFSKVQWQYRKQRRQVERGKIPARLKGKFFHCEYGQTLDQVTQGGSGLSILGDIQNLSYIHNWKQGPEQCDLTEPALSRGLDEMMLRDPFQIKCFMILWFYELWQTIWCA